jgi:hypothetical protein
MSYVLFLLLFSLGFFISFCSKEPRIKLGEHYIECNPKVKINLKKKYHLHLWDYNWSTNEYGLNYQNYLKQAILDFQKIYPNIQVELTLLDLLTGPAQLEQALKANNAPDVYCSANMIPHFNFKRQIPVGPYLKQSEKEIYLPGITKLLEYHGVLCYFPHWIAPGLWIGNKEFMDATGLSVIQIQTKGWNWKDLTTVVKRIPSVKYLLVGNLGPNGFFTQLTANAGLESTRGNFWSAPRINRTIDFLEILIQQKAIPADCDRNMLGRFLNGQAMFLAGVRPSMYGLIMKRLKTNKADWQPVLLPIPALVTGQENILVENSVIAIYRNKRTSGNDHLTAAIRFGQFLSCYEKTTPWEQLMVYPAAKGVFNKWIKKMTVNTDLYKNLGEQGIIKNLVPLIGYQEKVYPVLNDFVTQKITGAEVKIKLNKSYTSILS